MAAVRLSRLQKRMLANAFHASQTRPVQEGGHDPGGSRQVLQYRSDLVLGQHHGDAVRLFRAHHFVNAANILLERLLVQKQDGAQRLALCGGSDMACHRQMRQELLDLLDAHLARMPFAMKEDAAFYPM